MKPSPAQRARLVEVGALDDDDIDLLETALVLASAERPGVSLEPYRRHAENLPEEVRAYAGPQAGEAGLELRIEALVQVIVKRYGYGAGEDVFDDLESANLMRVIDSRSGLPVAVGILFIHAARAMGWRIRGIDFPGRFLVRLQLGAERAVLDPFGGGRALSAQDMRDMLKALSGNHAELTPEHYREMTDREVLLRLSDNLKTRLLREERFDDALGVLETMLLIAPKAVHLWRECGLLQARLERIQDAVVSLEEYLSRSGADDSRYNTSLLLQELRARLN